MAQDDVTLYQEIMGITIQAHSDTYKVDVPALLLLFLAFANDI